MKVKTFISSLAAMNVKEKNDSANVASS